MSERSFYVLAYDIPDDGRRAKIAKLCESSAERVQGSVFEGYLSRKEMEWLLKKVERILEDQEDSLRVYRLCAECREKITEIGVGRITPPPQVVIV